MLIPPKIIHPQPQHQDRKRGVYGDSRAEEDQCPLGPLGPLGRAGSLESLESLEMSTRVTNPHHCMLLEV